MRPRTSLVLAVLALLPLGAAATSAEGAGASVAGAELRVTLLSSAAGPFATHNRALADGAATAVRLLNAQGGLAHRYRVRLVRLPYTGREDARELVGRVGRGVLVLPCDTNDQAALARAADSRRLLTFAPCNYQPRMLAGLRHVWATGMAGNVQAGQVVGFARRNNTRRVVVLDEPGSSYVATMTRYLRRAARLPGQRLTIVATVAAPHDERGGAALLARLKKLKPDAIVTAVPAPTLQPVLGSLRAHGLWTPVYATDGMDAGLDLRRYGRVLKDVFFGSFGFARPSAEPFVRSYRETYGRLPFGSFPGLGYETLHVLEVAAARARSASPLALEQALRAGLHVPGVALADAQYRRGRRDPITDVGLSSIVRGTYQPLFSSVPSLAPAA